MELFRNISKKILSKEKYSIWTVLLVCLFFLLLIIIYSRGYIILGGEGNYFTDFDLARKYGSFTWMPLLNGAGASNPIINMLIPLFNISSFLMHLGASFKVVNILMVASAYIFPFLSMFWMTRNCLKIRFPISFIISLLYVINPFSTYHLSGLMFWNTAPLFMLPLSFGILYKYYFYRAKYFFIFGIVTSFCAFSFENLPYLGIFHIFLVGCALIIPFFRENVFNLRKTAKFFVTTELSFFLFNSWWLANTLRFYWQESGMMNVKNVSLNWSRTYVDTTQGILNKIFSLRTLLGPGNDSFFSSYYFSIFVLLVLSIPFVILVFAIFNGKVSKNKKKPLLFAFALLLILIFFNKGAFPPFGEFYLLCIKYVPLFELFKTPLEKFSVLFIFLFCLALALALNKNNNKLYVGILGVYLSVCSIPYLTFSFIPDFNVGENVYVSRKFSNKNDYVEAEYLLNKQRVNFRYLSLPGSKNYQVTMNNRDDRYYRGMDPVLYSINKGFVAAYSGNFNFIYNNLSDSHLKNILSIYNIGAVMLNKDIYPSYGFIETESPDQLDGIFSGSMKKALDGRISIFMNDQFLPVLYAPKHIIVSERDPREILRMLTQDNYDISSGIFFVDQNDSQAIEKLSGISAASPDEYVPPKIEFKKINPVKYRIRVHGSRGSFPLIFSETDHKGWRIYPVKSSNQTIKTGLFNQYKIISGNNNSQATKEELAYFIKNKLVTSLGDGSEKETEVKKWSMDNSRQDNHEKYSVDFISKNFYGTIQNDNLSDGKFWETWFKKPIDEGSDRLLANGYANSWIIDSKQICQSGDICSRNYDGTYDFEMVVEFWPQRLYYLGVFISGMTFLAAAGYLAYGWKKGHN